MSVSNSPSTPTDDTEVTTKSFEFVLTPNMFDSRNSTQPYPSQLEELEHFLHHYNRRARHRPSNGPQTPTDELNWVWVADALVSSGATPTIGLPDSFIEQAVKKAWGMKDVDTLVSTFLRNNPESIHRLLQARTWHPETQQLLQTHLQRATNTRT